MKNLLKKLSGAGRNDRREALEHEAAERIKEVGGHAPAEAYASEWATTSPSAPPSAPEPVAASAAVAPAPHAAPVAPAGRRLTVQERMAARELQNQ